MPKKTTKKTASATTALPRTTHTPLQTVLPDADVHYIDAAAKKQAEGRKK